MCVHACGYMWRPEEDIKFLGAGATGSCEPLNVGARNQTAIFYKSSKNS